jgi:Domain of unknown function (DUF6969)
MPQQSVLPETHFQQGSLFSGLPRPALLRMADAGVKVVDCVRDLRANESNLVIEALRGGGDFTEWEHYPPDDVRDPISHAQYYFHAHSPDDRDSPDYGHFHTFLRPMEMPPGIHRAIVDNLAAPPGKNDALAHLIAISMTPSGMPERLFTTNRWVTGETWYKAADVIAMLDRFVINIDRPSPALNQWLTAMFVLFRPQIEELLVDRDRVIEAWRREHPDNDVFEDRRLEITSMTEISLYEQIEALNAHLETML